MTSAVLASSSSQSALPDAAHGPYSRPVSSISSAPSSARSSVASSLTSSPTQRSPTGSLVALPSSASSTCSSSSASSTPTSTPISTAPLTALSSSSSSAGASLHLAARAGGTTLNHHHRPAPINVAKANESLFLGSSGLVSATSSSLFVPPSPRAALVAGLRSATDRRYQQKMLQQQLQQQQLQQQMNQLSLDSNVLYGSNTPTYPASATTPSFPGSSQYAGSFAPSFGLSPASSSLQGVAPHSATVTSFSAAAGQHQAQQAQSQQRPATTSSPYLNALVACSSPVTGPSGVPPLHTGAFLDPPEFSISSRALSPPASPGPVVDRVDPRQLADLHHKQQELLATSRLIAQQQQCIQAKMAQVAAENVSNNGVAAGSGFAGPAGVAATTSDFLLPPSSSISPASFYDRPASPSVPVRPSSAAGSLDGALLGAPPGLFLQTGSAAQGNAYGSFYQQQQQQQFASPNGFSTQLTGTPSSSFRRSHRKASSLSGSAVGTFGGSQNQQQQQPRTVAGIPGSAYRTQYVNGGSSSSSFGAIGSSFSGTGLSTTTASSSATGSPQATSSSSPWGPRAAGPLPGAGGLAKNAPHTPSNLSFSSSTFTRAPCAMAATTTAGGGSSLHLDDSVLPIRQPVGPPMMEELRARPERNFYVYARGVPSTGNSGQAPV